MIKLEINFKRRRVGVPVYIWNKNKDKFEDMTALFDTGAHTCAIDIDLFLRLGYTLDDAAKSYITTATKINEEVKRVRIDKIMLDDTEIASVILNTYEFPMTSYPIILGMNILRHYKLEMNFKERLITMNQNYFDSDDIYYDADTFGDWRADTGK